MHERLANPWRVQALPEVHTIVCETTEDHPADVELTRADEDGEVYITNLCRPHLDQLDAVKIEDDYSLYFLEEV